MWCMPYSSSLADYVYIYVHSTLSLGPPKGEARPTSDQSVCRKVRLADQRPQMRGTQNGHQPGHLNTSRPGLVDSRRQENGVEQIPIPFNQIAIVIPLFFAAPPGAEPSATDKFPLFRFDDMNRLNFIMNTDRSIVHPSKLSFTL